MKILRLLVLFLWAGNCAFATNVTIIESESFNSGHLMDVNWQTVATGMGYTATINPQSTLLVNTWFATTDILIVSSGVITLPQQAIDTIQSFINGGGHVFLQTEYLTSYATNGAFQSIADNLGGSFSWGSTTSGDLNPMMVSGSLSTTPNAVTSLSYFWYGDYGAGIGCHSRIEPFLEYQGFYYGFIFAMPTGTGRMITTCDQDWVNQYATTTGATQLMQNILSNLVIPNYAIAGGNGATAVTVPNAAVCGGQPANLTATPVGGSGGTYLWAPGGATTQSISVNPAVTTQYIVQYTTPGCGTVADTATVTVSNPNGSVQTQSICSGSSYNFYGRTITAAGTYEDTMTNAGGCDSIVTLTLRVLPSSTTTLTHTMCNGSSYVFNGQSLSTTGVYTDSLTSVNGCDSLMVLTLNVIQPVTTQVSQSVCSGLTYLFYGQTLNVAGTYNAMLTNAEGCDSTVVLTLTVVQPTNTFINRAICHGSSIVFGSQTITTAGTYLDTLTGAAGCDSFIILTVDTFSTSATALIKTICSGGTYAFAGQQLSNTGTYYDTLTNQAGCDSVVTLTLTVIQPTTTVITQGLCNGSSIVFAGQTITTAGTYLDTLTGAAGCDSIIVLTVNMLPVSASSINQNICNGGSYIFGGQALNATGTYYDTLTNAMGCDSVVTLTLTVLSTSAIAISQTICSNAPLNFNGQMLNTTGIYAYTLTNAVGCDSIVTLTLTVLQTSATNFSQSICNGNGYTFNGQILTNAGVYTDTFTNVAGCDSIVTLTLMILANSTAAIARKICSGSSYTFLGTQLTGAGTYVDTLPNAVGCDSVVTLILSVISPVTNNISQSICSGTSFNFNGRNISATGAYTDTLTAATGCDSIVILTLTVLPVSATAFSQTVCGSRGFVFNGITFTASGIYVDTLSNTVGCDSIVTLTLAIVPLSFDSTSATICAGNSYQFSGQVLTTSGIYRDTLTGAAGCDSTVVVTLNVVPIPVAGFSIRPSGNAMPLGNIYVINQSTGADTYNWIMNGEAIGLLPGGLLPVTQAGNYCVTLNASTLGCTDTVTDCILVYDNNFFIPNAFTPNGDGTNDYLELFGRPAGIKYLSISIFNRWGEKIFESSDLNFRWDGTYKGVLQDPGVFIYQLEVAFTDGNVVHNKGSVTLIR